MSTATAPFAVGDRVRLDRPEDPGHARKGRVGTVYRLRYWPEEVIRGRVVFNDVWMIWVRFDANGTSDRFDQLGVGADWVLIEGELTLVERKGGRP